MKLIFAGTPEFASVILMSLLSSEHEILAVYTQPDRPAGRGRKMNLSPVKTLAQEHELAVCQPERFSHQNDIEAILAFQAEAIVVAAYGLILPDSILNGPINGCINVHASLLPRWRGASPIQHAILAGDEMTGISIMQMEQGLDSGPVMRQCELVIDDDETGGSLHDRLAPLGAECLLQSLQDIQQGRAEAKVQDPGQTNYARRLTKSQALIDWQLDALSIERAVRAYHPWPVAHTVLPAITRGENQKPSPEMALRVHRAKAVSNYPKTSTGEIIQADRQGLIIGCGSQALNLLEVQAAGRRVLPVAEFLKASPLTPGMRLG
jgi:methionyl-tRNA formyltransferase